MYDTVKRVMDKDVYDYLELSALAEGGIGAWSDNDAKDCPNCVWGHAQAEKGGHALSGNAITQELLRLGIYRSVNDWAVGETNMQMGRSGGGVRVPFESWCKELNVVRGE